MDEIKNNNMMIGFAIANPPFGTYGCTDAEMALHELTRTRTAKTHKRCISLFGTTYSWRKERLPRKLKKAIGILTEVGKVFIQRDYRVSRLNPNIRLSSKWTLKAARHIKTEETENYNVLGL